MLLSKFWNSQDITEILCRCQLVRIPISSDVEVVNVSTTGTDVTAVFIVEMALMKSAVCITFLITAYCSTVFM